MSIYAFCNECKFIESKMMKGVNIPLVEERICPARGNPFEPMEFPNGTGEPEKNPHGCPRNERFMQIQKMKIIGYTHD
jgi:hypothetical protein